MDARALGKKYAAIVMRGGEGIHKMAARERGWLDMRESGRGSFSSARQRTRDMQEVLTRR